MRGADVLIRAGSGLAARDAAGRPAQRDGEDDEVRQNSDRVDGHCSSQDRTWLYTLNLSEWVASGLAIGAERGDIALLVFGRGLGLVVTGLALGTAAALAGTKVRADSNWLQPLLFNVPWFDPRSYLAIAIVTGVMSLLACALPVWRSATIDPMLTLRDE